MQRLTDGEMDGPREWLSECVLVNGERWENRLISPHIFACALIDTWPSRNSFLSTCRSFHFP
jgi:hypothetical protein